jgi:hypothetical protein
MDSACWAGAQTWCNTHDSFCRLRSSISFQTFWNIQIKHATDCHRDLVTNTSDGVDCHLVVRRPVFYRWLRNVTSCTWLPVFLRNVGKYLRLLIAEFSPRGPAFSPRSVHVVFVVDRVALEQIFLRVLRFSSVLFHRCSVFTHASSGGWVRGRLRPGSHESHPIVTSATAQGTAIPRAGPSFHTEKMTQIF